MKEVSAGLFVSTIVGAAILALSRENFNAPELLVCVSSGLLGIAFIGPFAIKLLTRSFH